MISEPSKSPKSDEDEAEKILMKMKTKTEDEKGIFRLANIHRCKGPQTKNFLYVLQCIECNIIARH